MRLFIALPLILTAVPATAHTGHLVEVGGHDHWVAGVIIGAAVIAGVWGALKGGRKDDEDAAPEEEEVAA